jgi:predicted DNA-binding transcriptional regulator AlpA
MSLTVSQVPRHTEASRLATAMIQGLDSLPQEACVPIDVVIYLTGRSRASIWRDVAAKRLPAPFKVGPRSTRWKLGDIRQAMAKMQGRV